jgi:hypothetical protein
MKKLLFRIVPYLLANGALLAQAVTVGPPVLGFATEQSTGAVRPIRGLAGAAVLGEPLQLDGAPALLAVSADKGYALGSSAEGGLQLFTLGSEKVTSRAIDETAAHWDTAVLSPTGAAALAYNRETRQALLVTGLPAVSAPRASFYLFDASLEPVAVAISDDGAILAAYSHGDYSFLLLRVADGRVRTLASPAGPDQISFLAGRDDALVTSGVSRQVYLLRGVTRGAQLIPLSGSLDQLHGRLLARMSADGRRVVVVGQQSSEIALIDAVDATLTYVSCDSVTSELKPLKGGSLYVLNDGASSPLWMLDATADDPRLYFAPARQPAVMFLPKETETALQDVPSLLLDMPANVRTGDQFRLRATVASAPTRQWRGQLRLDFTPDQDGADAINETLQFSTGGRVVDFTIPADATEVEFSREAVYVQSGLAAGRIVLTPEFSSAAEPSVPAAAVRVNQAHGGAHVRVDFWIENGQKIFEFVLTGATAAPPDTPRALVVRVNDPMVNGPLVEVRCESSSCPDGRLDLTAQFRDYLAPLPRGVAHPFELRLRATVDGSLENVREAAAELQEAGQTVYTCTVSAPIGSSWSCSP